MRQTYTRIFANKVTYKNIEFKSKMEADFAQFLDGQVIRYKGVNYWHEPVRWSYESQEFELIPQEEWIDRTERDPIPKTIVRNKKHILQRVIYTCDFWLPDYNLLVELKGKQFDDGLFHLRLRLFKHKYPDAKIWVVRHHDEFQKLDEVLRNIKIGEKE